jgi:hypothetical protein
VCGFQGESMVERMAAKSMGWAMASVSRGAPQPGSARLSAGSIIELPTVATC